ncbi:type 11 methyltransferase [Trypanosoma conorhini]|uniref:Type 11 methyltransferase n=1 Tax=Trypanosoma conorhini TaxID=83891 RepID=A0A3R7KW24_9TRYP|nr:type 11 methyltransferase [Trypanosoma conorhini]RNF16302.1 type 11 methyltransferase [Trypanosoma conorhini]
MSSLLRLCDCKRLKSALYDWVVAPVTDTWYREVLLQCPMDASVLGVGVGAAASLFVNRDIIQSKRLLVTGVVCDAEEARKAQDEVIRYELENQVGIVHASILEYTAPPVALIYLSGSCMRTPERVEVIKHCCRMLQRPAVNGYSCTGAAEDDGSGVLVFTPSFEKTTLWGLYVAPLARRFLKLLTTIDFGEATSEAGFLALLKQSGVRVVSMRTLQDSWLRKQVMVMAKPVK